MAKSRPSSAMLAKFGQARGKVKTIKAQLNAAERTANTLARMVGKAPKKKRRKKTGKKPRKKTGKKRSKRR